MAAEIERRPASDRSHLQRFNEAAANGRGNHAAQVDAVAPRGVPASMRPRRMAAEIGVISSLTFPLP